MQHKLATNFVVEFSIKHIKSVSQYQSVNLSNLFGWQKIKKNNKKYNKKDGYRQKNVRQFLQSA